MKLGDFLSVLRICLVPVLLTLGWLQLAQAYFWTLLVALGTDVAGGYLARRWGRASPRGGRFDSRADLALFFSMPVGVSLLFPELARHQALLLIMLIAAYLLTDIMRFLKGLKRDSSLTPGTRLVGQPDAQAFTSRSPSISDARI